MASKASAAKRGSNFATMRRRQSFALKPRDRLSERLGAQFRSLREAAGVSLRDLSDLMGVSLWCIRRHEAGEIMLRTDQLFRAAEHLKVRPTELLYIDREGL